MEAGDGLRLAGFSKRSVWTGKVLGSCGKLLNYMISLHSSIMEYPKPELATFIRGFLQLSRLQCVRRSSMVREVRATCFAIWTEAVRSTRF